MASQINQTICNMLPIKEEKYLISNSIDIINGKIQKTQDDDHIHPLIKQKTNLPATIHLQIGARIMFLNNSE